jgi:hypothetical protein
MPVARKEGLEVQVLADEVLVYDLDRHRAHCLNKIAALVWRHCDGKTSRSETARTLEKKLPGPADEELVDFTLAELRKNHLLEGPSSLDERVYSRREFAKKLKKLGLAATVMMPVVSSLVSPTPAYALSCVPNNGCAGQPDCTPCVNPGGSCTGTWLCCNGNCVAPGLAQSCGC